MNLARMSANGHVIVPLEIRQKLRLREGDKLLFVEQANGQIAIDNASFDAIARAQKAFCGAAADFAVKDESDIQHLVDEVRYGTKTAT
ncbi:MAG: AbrB/MazE/SpoVT family DNA-binding domain-containing protein [Spirochaetaceae bacterium]|jgi:AbrB family looped-hinge helix DNA binding protein|nr:AbrB/MazE/SpoVT family DNA-binding domain-containing protein [Spirochaetaceae bacterium]